MFLRLSRNCYKAGGGEKNELFLSLFLTYISGPPVTNIRVSGDLWRICPNKLRILTRSPAIHSPRASRHINMRFLEAVVCSILTISKSSESPPTKNFFLVYIVLHYFLRHLFHPAYDLFEQGAQHTRRRLLLLGGEVDMRRRHFFL